jgi:hypothetical protein
MIAGVEHDPVAHGYGADPLLVGVPACLGQRYIDRMGVPGERTRALDLDDQVLDT